MEKSDQASLDKFGARLIEIFKDTRLRWFEKVCRGEQKGENIQGLQNRIKALDPETQRLFAVYLAKAAMAALHDFLYDVDLSDDIQVFVDGKNLNKLSEVLYWEIFGSDGWEARFSQYPPHEKELIKYNQEQGLPYTTEEEADEEAAEFVDLLVNDQLKNYDDIDRLMDEQKERLAKKHKTEKKDS